MLFDPERTKDAGKRSGKARRRKAQERLTADRVLEELGPLETVDHAMRQLDRLNVWNASGLPTGSTNVAVVRSCVRSRRSDHLGAGLALKRRAKVAQIIRWSDGAPLLTEFPTHHDTSLPCAEPT